MRLEQLFEAKAEEKPRASADKKLVVVYGGRFQPFHRGHYQVYLWLCKKFGKGNVWIATSNKTNYNEEEGPISPFNFEEKREIMSGLYGIEARRIIQCKNPAFSPKEVFRLYRGFELVYVAACGKKDVERYENASYFLPLPKHMTAESSLDQMLTMKQDRGYFIPVPMKRSGISGSEAREALRDADDEDLRKTFEHYFGRWDDTIADLVISRLKEMK